MDIDLRINLSKFMIRLKQTPLFLCIKSTSFSTTHNLFHFGLMYVKIHKVNSKLPWRVCYWGDYYDVSLNPNTGKTKK